MGVYHCPWSLTAGTNTSLNHFLSIFLSLFMPQRLFRSLYISLCLSLDLSISLSVSISLCHSLNIPAPSGPLYKLFLSIPSLVFNLLTPPSLSSSLSLYLCVPICLYHCLKTSIPFVFANYLKHQNIFISFVNIYTKI